MTDEQQNSESNSSARGFRFRLVDLGVVVTVLCVLFAIGAIVIQGARNKHHQRVGSPYFTLTSFT
jgi:hypothetical protein